MNRRPTDVSPNGAHAIGAFAKCEYRYYLGHVKQLGERKRGFNLAMGTAWHRGMEAYYWTLALRETDGRCYPNRPQGAEFDLRWEADPVENAIQTTLLALGTSPEDAEPKEEEQWAWGRTWAPTALRAYDQFSKTYDANSSQVYLDAERTQPAIEVPFSFDLPADVPPYTGRLDRVYNRGGLRVVQEHKTSHPNYVALLEKQSRMSIQFGGYNLGYRAIFGVFPQYVELNAMLKSNIPQVHRAPISRNIEEVEYLVKLLYATAGRIADMRAQENAGRPVHWARTGILNGYCVDFNRHCLYMPICKAPNISLDEWGLDMMFKVGTDLTEKEFEE